MTERKPKILFLSSCVNGGGAGQSLSVYLSHATGQIEAHVVMPEPGVIAERFVHGETVWYVPQFVERVQRSSSWLARKLKFSWVHWACNFVDLPIATWKIIGIAKKVRPDVIYCNHMLANPIGAFVGGWCGIPVVFHARNIHVAWLGRKVFRFLGRRKCVKMIVCNSLASSLIYRECTEEKVRVIPNFVDLRRFDRLQIEPKLRKEFDIPADALVIGYLGRILAKKGILVLLEAFRQIYERFPKAVLVLVGDNDGGLHKNLRAEYEETARQMGIGERTFFVGFREDIRPYVSDFDIMTLPSVEPESFGRVLIESMALGIPSVVAAHGGAIEVVRHGLNGLWAKPGDAGELADAFARLLSDEKLRKRLGSNGFARVRSYYDSEALARRITQLLVSVTAEGEKNLRASSVLTQPFGRKTSSRDRRASSFRRSSSS